MKENTRTILSILFNMDETATAEEKEMFNCFILESYTLTAVKQARQQFAVSKESPQHNSGCADDNKVISREEAAKILNCCPQTVSSLVESGKIIGVGYGSQRSRSISYPSVVKFINGN